MKSEYSSSGDDDAIWQKLTTLVAKLTGLSDFYYDYKTPLPLYFITNLDRFNPACRLHLEQFWFRGYLSKSTPTSEDLQLLTSPHVRSVRTRSFGYIAEGREEYSHDAMFALADGMNPALQSISMPTDSGGAPGWAESWAIPALRSRVPRLPFDGFEKEQRRTDLPRAHLRSLELGGQMPVSMEMFEQLLKRCDYAELRTLKLWVPITHRGLTMLAQAGRLNSLTRLVLGVDRPDTVGSELDERVTATNFIQTLPPLCNFRLVGDLDEGLFNTVLKILGCLLRRLFLPTPHDEAFDATENFFNDDRVTQLVTSCNQLEELAITLPRSKGSAEEIGMYRSLGTLPRLRSLILTLDCKDMSLQL
jgi:hypothetical protein